MDRLKKIEEAIYSCVDLPEGEFISMKGAVILADRIVKALEFSMADKTCRNCNYLNHEKLDCMVDPPVPMMMHDGNVSGLDFVRPHVSPNDYCGRWSPNRRGEYEKR